MTYMYSIDILAVQPTPFPIIMEQNEKFIEQISDLHRLHCVTKDFNHIIEYQTGAWKMFKPSKFIYAYFAFNTLYNYDWPKSIEANTRVLIEDGKSERSKYTSMITFIKNNSDFDSHTNGFIKRMMTYNKNNLRYTKDQLITILNGITLDVNVKSSTKANFIEHIDKMLEENKLSSKSLKKYILELIYLVRNNIFHGTKNTIAMTESDQQKRLTIYTSILIGVNEMLFTTLQQQLNITFPRKYKFEI